MTLHKIRDFDPNYQEQFDNQDIIGADLYSNDEKIGSVDDVLVDDTGKIRYLVINTGIWIFGKKVLLPIAQARPAFDQHRVYVNQLTRDQVENLPAYDEATTLDYDYEEQVRGVYRPTGPTVESSMAMDANAQGMPTFGESPVMGTPMASDTSAVESSMPAESPMTAGRYDRDTYTYDRDPALYNLNEHDHQNFRLYEERLMANKSRAKTGEVSVGKRVETTTENVSIPLERERVIIEQTAPTEDRVVDPTEATFQEGEMARMEVYEERPDIRKEAVVREEVNVRKEVSHETVDAQEQVRRERVDIRSDGDPVVEKRPDPLPDEQI